MMPSNNDKIRWTTPLSCGRSRRQILEHRHTIKRHVRDYFHYQGFLEIDCPLLVSGTTPDAGIQSFAVGSGRFLVTSTEYQIKRLEAGGFERIYSLGSNFREGDVGPHNNPEFTMLEWARVGAPLSAVEQDIEMMMPTLAETLNGKPALTYQGRMIDLSYPWPRRTVQEAISSFTRTPFSDFSLESLQAAAAAAELNVSPALAASEPFLFSAIMSALQRTIGWQKPVFLRDWPVFQTSSAPLNADQSTADRSELIVAGIELADGFPTLTDPEFQKAAFDAQLEQRRAESLANVPLDRAFLDALDTGLPLGAGMALGFDRLVMLLCDQTEINTVLAFAWNELE